MNKYLLFLFLLGTISIYSQFDSLLFKKRILIDKDIVHAVSNIISLGDQNSDGCDDFLIISKEDLRGYIFYGGNPVDTLPELSLPLDYYTSSALIIGITDINYDGKKDIILNLRNERKFSIYYGGSLLDSIPDLQFSHPSGSSGIYSDWAVMDFNGDGKEEWVIFDPFLRYSNEQFGSIYFYNTAAVFDTIPEYIVSGDSNDSLRIDGNITSSGDINGDGKSDFTLYGYKTENGINRYFRRFYLGNDQWEFDFDAEYIRGEHIFDVQFMEIVQDLNKDGRDDILMNDYDEFYPYWFGEIIIKGSFPIDTIPSWGLNTQNVGINQLRTVNLGDVNGDGFNDFMAPTYTFYGLKLWVGARNYPTDNTADKTWQGGGDGFCIDFAAPGDVNGDGIDDIAIAQVPLPPYTWYEPMVFIFSGDTTVKADTTLVLVEDNKYIPSEFILNEPYPNPFNPSAVISWNSSERALVKISLFDLLGRETAILLDEEREAGTNRIELNADKYNLSSGVYIIQLEAYISKGIIYKKSKKISYIK